MPDTPSYSGPRAELIVGTANPDEELDYQIQLRADDFSVLDPESGRPAHADLELTYWPSGRCVDRPGLAMYLLAYRQERMTVEQAACKIVKDFAEAVDPHQLRLEAAFTSRDGIEATLIVPWPPPDEDEGWDPDPEE